MISIVLTYFDPTLGPRIYLVQPENTLDPELTKRIEKFMELDFGEISFEINLPDIHQKTFNHMLNLPSNRSRGSIELFLLSIVADTSHNSEEMFDLLKKFSHDFLSSIDANIDISKNLTPMKELLFKFRRTLIDKFENADEKGVEESAFDVLNVNLQNLTRNIARKNEFQVINFQLNEKPDAHYLIQMELKGKGFLTRALKQVTFKSVYNGIEKYMISNAIPKDHFSIKIR